MGLSQEPLSLFLMNALLGIAASIRVGSVLALWIQHSPQDRVGESLAYNNILLAIGGIGGALLGFLIWPIFKNLSFIFFGGLLLISVIPIFFITDSGEYIPFSFTYVLNTAQSYLQSTKEKVRNSFFLSKPVIQVSIHWLAFATIASFATFLIPIIERILEEVPSEAELYLPLLLLILILMALLISCVGGLVMWGRVSDSWSRRPVLVIGYAGALLLIFFAFLLIQFDWIPLLINGLINNEPISLLFVGMISLSVFFAISLVPIPMAWISDKVGQNDLGKAMSIRQVLIGIGTVIGTMIGAIIIGTSGVVGLLLIIFIFLMISAVILL
ncbi:MAG: MFS transporter [Candidatus Hodarchaeota archaeon]